MQIGQAWTCDCAQEGPNRKDTDREGTHREARHRERANMSVEEGTTAKEGRSKALMRKAPVRLSVRENATVEQAKNDCSIRKGRSLNEESTNMEGTTTEARKAQIVGDGGTSCEQQREVGEDLEDTRRCGASRALWQEWITACHVVEQTYRCVFRLAMSSHHDSKEPCPLAS